MSEDTTFEQKHVIDIYNQIAKSFDTTRNHIWPKNRTFFNNLCQDPTKNTKILDAGCGNGRNMIYLIENGCTDVNGCDVSDEFVKICTEKKLSVQQENLLNMSYNDNTFDHIICIAVIHHLSKDERRIQAISELVRVVKPGGTILIQVWALEQKFSKIIYSEKDVMIPWKRRYHGFEKMDAERYYHLFEKNELETLCSSIKGVIIKESYDEHDNYGIILEKT